MRNGSTWRRCVVLALAVAGAGAGVVGLAPARAANSVPNPGFEDVCGEGACAWPQFSFAGRDTAITHTGTASYRLTPPPGASTLTMPSQVCVEILPPTGPTTASFWYHTTSAAITNVSFAITQYLGPGCDGTNFVTELMVTFPSPGAWHEITSSAGSNWQSYRMSLTMLCGSGCPGQSARFDDLVVDRSAPTAVQLAELSATRAAGGVRVRWVTRSESKLLGYNVYRSRGARLVKLNRHLIRGIFGGTRAGHTYTWFDRSALRGALYRLQAVRLDGRRSWLASATAR